MGRQAIINSGGSPDTAPSAANKINAMTTELYGFAATTVNTPAIALQRYRAIPNSTARIIGWVGDSTTINMFAQSVGAYASVLNNYVPALYQYPGGPYYNVTHQNYGENGQTLQNFADGAAGAGKNISDVIAGAPNLIVLSYGINDVRLGVSSKATLKTNLTAVINALQAGLPNTDIILRIPNSILYDAANSPAYIDAPVTLAKVQGYSDRMYDAYTELAGQFRNVYVLDTRVGKGKIFSMKSRALANAGFYMGDALHPTGEGYAAIAREVALCLGDYGTSRFIYHDTGVIPALPDLSPIAVYSGVTANATYPFLVEPRAVEDPKQYNLILAAAMNSFAAGSYVDLDAFDYNAVPSVIQYTGIIAVDDVITQYGVTTTTPGAQGEIIESGVASWRLTSGSPLDFGAKIRMTSMPAGYPLAQPAINKISIYRKRPTTQKYDQELNVNINLFAPTFAATTLYYEVTRFSVIPNVVGLAGTAVTTGGTVDIKKNGTTVATLTWANGATVPTYSGTMYTNNTRGMVCTEGDILSAVVNSGFAGGANLKINFNNK